MAEVGVTVLDRDEIEALKGCDNCGRLVAFAVNVSVRCLDDEPRDERWCVECYSAWNPSVAERQRVVVEALSRYLAGELWLRAVVAGADGGVVVVAKEAPPPGRVPAALPRSLVPIRVEVRS